MKKLIAVLSALCILLTASTAFGEEPEEDYGLLYVMCKDFQGRIRPGKKFEALVSFDMWTPLKPTGRMSDDCLWVEVKTAESELVWCNINYLTETRDLLRVYTLWDEGVKIRSKPGGGKVTGTARKEQVLDITQVVMGYGRCSKGWVDMEYFIIDSD